MKLFILLSLVVLATVYAEDEDKPQRSRPTIFVDFQHPNKDEAYQFNFAIAHVEELNEEKVSVYKSVPRKPWTGPDFEEPKFNITLKTLDGEEFKQWWEENKKGRDGQTKPFPNKEFVSAIIGDVNIDSVNCKDHQSYYLVKHGKSIPKRLPNHGVFQIKVKGCPDRLP